MFESLNITAPNLVTVCIDRVEHGEYTGRIHTRTDVNPIRFSSLLDMTMKMDRFFNQLRFPQATLRNRSFLKNGSEECAGTVSRTLNIVQEAEKILEQRGENATFVVHVQHRQNATWQGKLVWAEKNQEIPFRSALEMLRMMDQVICPQARAEELPEND